MTSRRPRTTATKTPRRSALRNALLAGFLLAGLGAGSAAWAAAAGVVVNLSGPLMDRKPDGTVRILGVKSQIESGDTLVTEKNTYAQIRFIDNGDITLRPGTTFKVENFSYDAGKPEEDSAAFNLIKGGLRSITGLLGKRNKEKFQLKTPTATIGIRGTTFIAQFVEDGAAAAGAAAALPPGLHVTVTEGAIMVSNGSGAQGVAAGQFGFVPGANLAPVLVPPNPGVQFAPPPAFGASGSGPAAIPLGGAAASGTPGAQQGPDCVVR